MNTNYTNDRTSPEKFTFSDDFKITYKPYETKPNKNSNKNIEVKYSMRMPISKEQDNRNQNDYGRMALKNRLSVKVTNKDMNNLKNILFNRIWHNNDVRKNVMEEVETLLRIYKKKRKSKDEDKYNGSDKNNSNTIEKKKKKKQCRINGVRFCFFSYIYIEEFEREIGFDENTLLLLIKDERIGNIFLCKETTEEEINTAANNYYKKTKRVTKKDIQYIR